MATISFGARAIEYLIGSNWYVNSTIEASEAALKVSKLIYATTLSPQEELQQKVASSLLEKEQKRRRKIDFADSAWPRYIFDIEEAEKILQKENASWEIYQTLVKDEKLNTAFHASLKGYRKREEQIGIEGIEGIEGFEEEIRLLYKYAGPWMNKPRVGQCLGVYVPDTEGMAIMTYFVTMRKFLIEAGLDRVWSFWNLCSFWYGCKKLAVSRVKDAINLRWGAKTLFMDYEKARNTFFSPSRDFGAHVALKSVVMSFATEIGMSQEENIFLRHILFLRNELIREQFPKRRDRFRPYEIRMELLKAFYRDGVGCAREKLRELEKSIPGILSLDAIRDLNMKRRGVLLLSPSELTLTPPQLIEHIDRLCGIHISQTLAYRALKRGSIFIKPHDTSYFQRIIDWRLRERERPDREPSLRDFRNNKIHAAVQAAIRDRWPEEKTWQKRLLIFEAITSGKDPSQSAINQGYSADAGRHILRDIRNLLAKKNILMVPSANKCREEFILDLLADGKDLKEITIELQMEPIESSIEKVRKVLRKKARELLL